MEALLENRLGMTLALALLVLSMVAVAGVQILLCIRCRSLSVRLIPVFVCAGLILLSILGCSDPILSTVLTVCSTMLLLFAGVGWAVARLILKNRR